MTQSILNDLPCQICKGNSIPLDVVDFNRSGGAESRREIRRLSGIPIYYYLCKQCGFCFAPEICKWSIDEFSEKIYNEEYIDIDPDHDTVRPNVNFTNLTKAFENQKSHIKHLDYGGGNGQLSYLLAKSGWDSLSYDPFINKEVKMEELGKFNLITAYEVFEHVPDANKLMASLNDLISDDGLIMFSTLISDDNIKENQRLTWWYASPRNGHISLYSKKSLQLLANNYQFNIGHFSPLYHLLYRNIPQWATHIFK